MDKSNIIIYTALAAGLVLFIYEIFQKKSYNPSFKVYINGQPIECNSSIDVNKEYSLDVLIQGISGHVVASFTNDKGGQGQGSLMSDGSPSTIKIDFVPGGDLTGMASIGIDVNGSAFGECKFSVTGFASSSESTRLIR